MADAKDKMQEPDALMEAARRAFSTPFGAVIELAPNKDACLWIDGREDPPSISTTPFSGAGADCVWSGRRETLVRALSGARAIESAYLSGRITIAGDMSVMARVEVNEER